MNNNSWSKGDLNYKETLKSLLLHGVLDENPRTVWNDGTPAHSYQIFQRFEDYGKEIPLNNFRNTAMKMGIQEMFWIYQDQTNHLGMLRRRGITWWDNWDIGNGTIGFRYGQTIYRYNLLNKLLSGLLLDPFSRRHIVSMWQETDFHESEGLRPCAFETIWNVRREGRTGKLTLDMTLIQRSNDYLVAGYINKFQYWALLQMVAKSLNYEPGNFCHYTHNVHYYDRHVPAFNELLEIVKNYEPYEPNQAAIFHGKNVTNDDPYWNFMEYKIDDWEFITKKNLKIESPLEVAI